MANRDEQKEERRCGRCGTPRLYEVIDRRFLTWRLRRCSSHTCRFRNPASSILRKRAGSVTDEIDVLAIPPTARCLKASIWCDSPSDRDRNYFPRFRNSLYISSLRVRSLSDIFLSHSTSSAGQSLHREKRVSLCIADAP